jgi:signal transduction histidine kinase
MRANSLALRLFLSATAWTVVILFATGVVLSSFYRHAVERAFDRRLGVYLKTIVADVASPEETPEKFPQSLGEPLFELPLSGWYWQVTRLDPQKPEVRSSRSLWDSALPRLEGGKVPTDAGGSSVGYVQGPENQRLRLFERTIDLGEEGRYLISVAGDAVEIDDEMRTFNEALALTFCVLAVVLLLTTMFQVRFGLAPLKRISESLAAIRSGAAERLEGTFPDEIAPLARETNALIEANREIVQRARTHVGNLAHALKTPLSVIVNEAAAREDAFAAKVREQTDIMRDQVARHLERARLAARLSSIGSVTEIGPVVTALARTMEKIHHDRGIAIDVEAPEDVRFRGERQDLEEMIGNLVDNACKWAKSRVSVEVLRDGSAAREQPLVRLVIDDDGPGLSPAQREEAQEAHRGRRLDETKPGSGLGLSIVVELADLYGGELSLGTAPIGGLRAELVLPAA